MLPALAIAARTRATAPLALTYVMTPLPICFGLEKQVLEPAEAKCQDIEGVNTDFATHVSQQLAGQMQGLRTAGRVADAQTWALLAFYIAQIELVAAGLNMDISDNGQRSRHEFSLNSSDGQQWTREHTDAYTVQ